MTVKQEQLLLEYLDCSPGVIDGLDGDKTRAARTKYKAKFGIDCTSENLLAAVNGAIAPIVSDFWTDIHNFSRSEFKCPCSRCGGFPTEPQEQLVRLLQNVRDHFGKPITVSSGVRCQAHNDELPGSVWNSRHILGKAVDFSVQGISATIVKVYLDKLVSAGKLRYCYIIDANHVHMDIL